MMIRTVNMFIELSKNILNFTLSSLLMSKANLFINSLFFLKKHRIVMKYINYLSIILNFKYLFLDAIVIINIKKNINN